MITKPILKIKHLKIPWGGNKSTKVLGASVTQEHGFILSPEEDWRIANQIT